MRTIVSFLVAGSLAIGLSACSGPDATDGGHAINHDFSGDVRPWTHENFDADGDKFTFAVFSDLTGVDIANLLMSGVLDKTGQVPLGGDDICFEQAVCGD